MHGLSADGTPIWIAEPGVPFYSAPAEAADGTLFVSEHSFEDGRWVANTISAYRPGGNNLWRRRLDRAPNLGPVINADGNVFWTTETELRSVSPSGEIRWSRPLEQSPRELTLGNSNSVLISSGVRLTAFDGPEANPKTLTSGLAVSSGIQSADGFFYTMTTQHGPGEDRRDWALAANGSALFSSGRIVGEFSKEGRAVWNFEAPGENPNITMAHATLGLDGRVYVVSGARIFCIETDLTPAVGWSMLRAHPRGTASLHRSPSPAARLQREPNGWSISIPAAHDQAFTILATEQLLRWRIIGHGKGPMNYPIPEAAEASPTMQFYRIAVP
jgi:outer membrane protein assembly factor BamB